MRFSVCLVAFVAISASADVLVMKNGDRVTGSVVKKDGKTITLKTASFGDVTAAWADVASLEAAAPLTVVLAGGKTVAGAVNESEGTVKIAATEGPVTSPAAEVVAIRNDAEEKKWERLQHPTWFELWAGSATVGLAGTGGNARTNSLTVAFNAARSTNTDKTYLSFTAIDASASVNGVSTQTAKAVSGGIGYDHQLRPRLFVNVFNNYEFDKFQSLDLRFTLGGGLGYNMIKTARRQLDLIGGGSYDRANFSTPLVQSAAAVYWGDDFNQKLGARSTITQRFRMFNDLNAGHEFRTVFDAVAATKIGRGFTWNLALNDRYESVPAPGRNSNDWLYTTGLGYTFGK